MLLSPIGGMAITNDGHCILREVDVSHPAAKSMIELASTQAQIGDGTTTVIVLSGELLILSEPLLTTYSMHPIVIIRGYNKAMMEALEVCEEMARDVSLEKLEGNKVLNELVSTCLNTKFSNRWKNLMVKLALESIQIVKQESVTDNISSQSILKHRHVYNNVHHQVDIKRYVKVEKIPGETIEDSCVLHGIMIQKDLTHSSMRRTIEKPRILLLDCPLEYKKGESQTNVEISTEEDWTNLLRMEEEYVENICMEIIAFNPDIVITEKGVSDLAQHYLQKANITALRRVRKSDNNRIARAVGATIVSRTDEIEESDIGTGCGLFQMKKISEDWYCFLENCADPKACTVLLRGGSTDILNEIERNLEDAMEVIRNIVYEPRVVPGGGATEMAISVELERKSRTMTTLEKRAYEMVGKCFEVIPRTLAENCGVSVIRAVTQLRQLHLSHGKGGNKDESKDNENNNNPKEDTLPHSDYGVNGETGELVNMSELGIWEPLSVKVHAIQTAIENACMILRIDDIVAGSKSKKEDK